MTEAEAAGTLEIVRCPACRGCFPPRPGACPRCGQSPMDRLVVPDLVTVLAAMSLEFPPAPWPAPHRIVLVESTEGARFLAVADRELPRAGAVVHLRRDGDRYRIGSGN